MTYQEVRTDLWKEIMKVRKRVKRWVKKYDKPLTQIAYDSIKEFKAKLSFYSYRSFHLSIDNGAGIIHLATNLQGCSDEKTFYATPCICYKRIKFNTWIKTYHLPLKGGH